MASSSGSDLLTFGLLAVAGYLAYEWFFATPATTTTTTSGTTTSTPPASTTTTTPPSSPPAQIVATLPTANWDTVAGVINSMAQGTLSPTQTYVLNLDQWSYYYNQYATEPAQSGSQAVPGLAPLTTSQISQIMAAANITSANRSTVTMTAGQFVALLQAIGITGSGLSGFGAFGFSRRPVQIPVPALYANRGRGFGLITLGDLRRIAQTQ